MKPFIIGHTFDAPRDVVFKAWTTVEGIKNWMGPKHSLPERVTVDLRPGGMSLFMMRWPNGEEMWGKWTYREIAAPSRFVAVVSFTDETGSKLLPHPMNPDWPREVLSHCEFAEKDGKTAVTITWQPLNPTPIEQKTFDAGFDTMTMGWGGSFEKLDAYLK